jgi:hypothetical protein
MVCAGFFLTELVPGFAAVTAPKPAKATAAVIRATFFILFISLPSRGKI